jgi:hypothetical protein
MAPVKSTEERMHRLLRIISVLLPAVFLCAFFMPASPAQARQLGNTCVGVTSQNNWHGTICAIVNLDDARADQWGQALITFSVRSGSIYEVFVTGGLYLRRCAAVGGGCANQNYVQSPSKFPVNAQSTFISDSFGYDSSNSVQARVNTPCIIWTNGQEACVNYDLRSSWVYV